MINAITLSLLMLLVASCREHRPRYVIGVSQCSADIWREKQNAELRMGTYFQDGVELRFAAAYDSDERQVQQIDSLVATGIDLLIVAPNQVQTISPAIDRAFDKGLPVIVFERKTSSQKYTAFMSADNYEMGRQMGEYIAARLGYRGNILEVKGLEGSSPAIERHKGFMDVVSQWPDLHVVGSLKGDWTEPTAYAHVRQWCQAHPTESIDMVFGLNDRTAIGARKALQERGGRLPLFCGIDGLPGEGGGIQLVRDSILDASYIYPTRGDELLQLAVDILDGKPYERETRLMSAIVTRKNAQVLQMQSDEMLRQSAWLDQLHQKADIYLQQLDTQRTITLLALVIIALLVVSLVLFYRYHIGKLALRRERVVSTLWDLSPQTLAESMSGDGSRVMADGALQQPTPTTATPEPSPTISESSPTTSESSPTTPEPLPTTSEPLPDISEPSPDTSEPSPESSEPSPTTVSATIFMARFREAVESRLEDSALSIEDLAADMHLSRVQLYRKVKTITGSTPVELLRTARLKRAYQLLLTTDKNVSEIAYQVGFTAPSYFTKCFKEEYGQLPGDVRS